MGNKGKHGKIVVVGAGISGLTAALHIAESGEKMILIDKSLCSGGILPMLDHQFPDNHCGMCRILPMINREGTQDFCLKRGVFHENIEFYPLTELKSVDGAPGDFTVGLKSVTGGELYKKEHISAVILAGGNDLFDPSDNEFYGMANLPNVITALAFERLMSGRTLQRPSDGKEPEKIAWIQCVGSRNITAGSPSCSSACCMFAVKEAVFAKEKTGGKSDTVIFYMDMRTFGRDFQRYKDSAEKEKGIRFIRCRIHSIEPGKNEGDLEISYVDNKGEKINEIFSLVVLSTGRKDYSDDHLFCKLAEKDGVFLLESAREFRDIPEAVKGAQAAISEVMAIVKNLPFTGDEYEIKKEPAVLEKKPAILVLIIKKGNFAGMANRESIQQRIEKLFTGVEIATVEKMDDESMLAVKEIVNKKKLNKLIAASEHPPVDLPSKKYFSNYFQIPVEYIRLISLFPNFQRIDNAEEAEDFIISRISEGISFLERAGKYPEIAVPVNKKALVIGSGPAGLSAAKSFADAGINVVVLEKRDKPGGNIASVYSHKTRRMLDELLFDVENSSSIKIITGVRIVGHSGRAGNFRAFVKHETGETETIEHGAVVLATGGGMVKPLSYGFGKDKNIVTIHSLGKMIQNGVAPKKVVMIQCVDSREEPKNYCSRICCLKSLETAIELKDKFLDSSVFIFYRDMMTYGSSENLYTEARKKGVVFIPFDPAEKPVVRSENGELTVTTIDPLSGAKIKIKPDIVGLSTGLVPQSGAEMAGVFNIDTTQDGFIKEADYKWRPVDTGKEGAFVCGLARAPGRVDEVMEDGRAAAARAMRILEQKILKAPCVSARVKHAVCSRCGLCIKVCPFEARYYDKKKDRVMVDPVSCQGCGVCAVECPNSATVIGGFEDGAIMDALENVFYG